MADLHVFVHSIADDLMAAKTRSLSVYLYYLVDDQKANDEKDGKKGGNEDYRLLKPLRLAEEITEDVVDLESQDYDQS